MIIEEKVKSALLHWDSNKPIYEQFKQKCSVLSKLSGIKIIPNDYYVQYQLQESSLDTFTELQTDLYKTLYNKYPNLDFGMSGRLKSIYSHYEKVIRKYIELFERDEFKIVEIFDDYGIKIFIMAVKYHVDKISTDLDGIYIDSGADEFRICDNDCFDIPYNGKILNVPVNKNQTNVFIDNHIPYISTNINGKEIKLPLSNAVTYKKSNKYDLVDYCRDIQYTVEDFYNARGFETKKRKDYISRPKKSGYESRQCSFYSDDQNLGLECQIRTYDMEKYSNQERTYGYKPHESKISNNSLSSISRFALTTRFADGTIQTYTMSDAECFKYIYGMSLKEYRLKMRSAIEGKENNTSKGEAR